MKSYETILAGDIGGTKTLLALFSPSKGMDRPIVEKQFASREHPSLDEILERFLNPDDIQPVAAVFGIAGRVTGRQCRTTNLQWRVDADSISRKFRIGHVCLLNDLQATALLVPHLRPESLLQLNSGQPDRFGTIGVVAPGTGLGESFLTWTGTQYQAWPSEGGHASFAPTTQEQRGLLEFLATTIGHVSYERVCSGSGIPNLYAFLLETGRFAEPAWLKKQFAESSDPAPIIIQAGYEKKAAIGVAVLDLFVQILGNALGNTALNYCSTGGLYLGGGIPVRIQDRLKQPDFLNAICYKGRFADWISRIPVSVILEPKAALYGAARHAIEIMKNNS